MTHLPQVKSDLTTLSANNILSKYADDINILVPQYCDVDLLAEFDNIRSWAERNKMTVNLSKTEEIFFFAGPFLSSITLCLLLTVLN